MLTVIEQLSSDSDNEAKYVVLSHSVINEFVFHYHINEFCYRCEAMERLVQLILEEEDIDNQVISQLAYSLSVALQKQFEDPVFPAQVNDE